MKVGDSATLERRFTRPDLNEYAALAGTAPGAGHVPAPLIGALFSCLLGMELPGLGTNYLKQETTFHHPARVDEPLTARVTITRLRPEKHLVDLETTCTGRDGRTVADGRALVYVREVGVPRHD